MHGIPLKWNYAVFDNQIMDPSRYKIERLYLPHEISLEYHYFNHTIITDHF